MNNSTALESSVRLFKNSVSSTELLTPNILREGLRLVIWYFTALVKKF